MEHRPSHILADRRPSETISEEVTPRATKTLGVMHHEQDITTMGNDMVSPKNTSLAPGGSGISPPLTARRTSTAFDEVQLSELKENGDTNEPRGRSTTTSSNNSERSHSSVSASRPPLNPKTSNVLHSQSVSTGSVPWGPSPQPKQPMPAGISRKLSSPFAWLSRKKSAPVDSVSAPQQHSARRYTAVTAGSLGGNPDLMLKRLDEEPADSPTGARIPARETLKERFKILRMREEAGITLVDTELKSHGSQKDSTAALAGSAEDVGLGIKAPKGAREEEESALMSSPPPVSEADAPIGSTMSRTNSIASSFDPNLAPGTVSGISSGPSAMQDPEAPVDWDLWQSVVYEGPAAVAKTSADELNRAIASGIPSAIRGVVWQVLAQSKNEELEGVYRELVLRGTDKELQKESPNLSSGPHSANSLASNGTHKDSIVSSASSIHSEHSTPATTNGMTSPSLSQDIDTAKLQAAMNAERAKKAKEDTAALKKLEKTIRKDLGSRSNYSKYAAAAGLQEGLFGVCKAYALFDEGVGYAQGMNFIVMPLLFNVRLFSCSRSRHTDQVYRCQRKKPSASSSG